MPRLPVHRRPPSVRPLATILRRASRSESRRVGDLLRKETSGGLLLMAAALVALMWANSPAADAYFALRDLEVGPPFLRLSLGAWAADGLLALFFFLVGLELKTEFVTGDLRDPRRALVPVAAAASGVAIPALVYALVNLGSPATLRGWAIPAATDIAFALAVLALVGAHLPGALRLFLLTLAVVDDLIAIVIIAVFYTGEVDLGALGLFCVPVALYALLVHRRTGWFARTPWAPWVVLLPVAVVAWGLLHASGVHATIAGVVLGFLTPVRRGTDAEPSLAATFEHRYRPLSTGVAVPVFAFFSAGVSVGGWGGLLDAATSPVATGIVAGLVLGKPIGIVGSTFLLTRLTRARLDDSIRWSDLVGVGLLGGIGFTVSLLVGELSFGSGSPFNDAAKVGVLLASALAAAGASAVLVPRNRRYRRMGTEDAPGDARTLNA